MQSPMPEGQPAPRRLLPRIGVRGRVFTYFSVFTALLLALLWLFQIAMLPYFYRLQKSQVLGAAVDTLAANINSKELQQLAERLSLADDVGILIVDEVLTEAVSTADRARQCAATHDPRGLQALDQGRGPVPS